MDFLIEGLGRGIFAFFRWILVTILVDAILYGLGFAVLKVVTLGRYPIANRDNQTLCLFTGLLSIIAVIVFFAVYNQRG